MEPSPASAATPRPASTFQNAAKKPASSDQKPFLDATAAAPPTMSAARPYSAMRSPALNSLYFSPGT